MKGLTMPHIETMAVEITPKTYPIAVACLPPAFATLPTESVLGHYLVINELVAKSDKKGHWKKFVLGNCYMSAVDFEEVYVYAAGSDTSDKEQFTVVQKIAL